MEPVPMDRAEQILADVCDAAFGDEERAAECGHKGLLDLVKQQRTGWLRSTWLRTALERVGETAGLSGREGDSDPELVNALLERVRELAALAGYRTGHHQIAFGTIVRSTVDAPGGLDVPIGTRGVVLWAEDLGSRVIAAFRWSDDPEEVDAEAIGEVSLSDVEIDPGQGCRGQSTKEHEEALDLLGELAERVGFSMSLDATLLDHAHAIREGLDQAEHERDALAHQCRAYRLRLERIGERLGVAAGWSMTLDELSDRVEAAAREPRPEDARDAARLILRGGLATGDHELAIELALRALEGR